MIVRPRRAGAALALVPFLVLAAACARSTGAPPVPPGRDTSAGTASGARAPWSAATLDSASVPLIYHAVWRRADNRATCALLAPAQLDLALARESTSRAATFSGGWAVAYDTPQVRSAFGVAGAGVSAWGAGVYDDWPHRLSWNDGSRAGYGPEDASGTNWLAYVRIPGQDCLYNVWSRRGRAHLEELIASLRFVAPARP